MKIIRILAILLAVCAPCVAQEADVETLLAQADPAIQAQIATTASAFLSGGNSESEVKTNLKGFQELDKLKKLEDNEQQLVNQLAIYAATEQREEQWQVVEALLVLQLLNFEPSIPIRVLAPHLGSGNPQVRELAQLWLKSHDSCGDRLPRQALLYEDYLQYIRRQGHTNEEVPAAFIEYLYERSPGQALVVFYHAARAPAGLDEAVAKAKEIRQRIEADQREQEKRGEVRFPLPPMKNPLDGPKRQPKESPPTEILLAEHIVSNAIWLNANKFDQEFQTALPEAKERLSKLAEYEQWWVRRYVVEIMRRHPELRQDDILKKLEADDHALVRRSTKLRVG